jgi:hypothetical protein
MLPWSLFSPTKCSSVRLHEQVYQAAILVSGTHLQYQIRRACLLYPLYHQAVILKNLFHIEILSLIKLILSKKAYYTNLLVLCWTESQTCRCRQWLSRAPLLNQRYWRRVHKRSAVMDHINVGYVSFIVWKPCSILFDTNSHSYLVVSFFESGIYQKLSPF